MSEFPRGWSTRVIEEICDIHDYRRIPLSSEERRERKGPYPYYGANNIQDRIDDFIFDFDAVLIAEDGGYYDEHEYRDIAQYATGKYWVNNHAHILTGKPGLDTRFLYYALVRKNICPWINTGTRSKLNQSDLKQIELLVPPLPEQKKIAEILSGIDERIVASQNQEKYYSLLLESTLRDSFSHEADETKTLGEIAEFKSGRAFKSEELSEDGIKVTRISNLHKPNFPYWRYKGEYNPRIVARDGDILFSWAGVANSINVHRYKGENTLLNQHIYNFEFCDQLLKEWTYWNLKTMLPKLRASIEGGAGQLHLTKGFIQSLPIPVIERSRMESLCNCFQSIDHLVEIQKIASTKAKALKTALSSDLLSGRKRVSNARVLDGVGV